MLHLSEMPAVFHSLYPRARALSAALAFLICIFAAQNATAATFVVNTTADTQDTATGDGVCADAGGLCSLRAAITQANALAGDDIITLPAGTYTQTLVGSENANATGDFDITSNITINGAGAGSTVVQSATTTNTAVERVIHFFNSTAGTTVTASLNNLTVNNGKTAAGAFGAGARIESTSATTILNVTFNSVAVSGNVAQGRGGGIYVVGAGSTLTANNNTVTNNQSAVSGTSTAGAGGAGFYQNGGTATFNNTAINNNTTTQSSTGTSTVPPASAFGGGVTIVSGTLNLNDSTVNGNTATTSTTASAFAGGIAMGGGTVNLTNSTVSNNTTSTTGTGGAFVGGIDNEQATLNMTNSTVSGNTAANSGGIRALSSTIAATVTVNRSAIVNNTGTTEGGGIFAVSVGAAAATITLNNSTVGGNSTNGVAGGVETFAQAAGNSIVNLNYSTVAGNTAAGGGGGVANFGQQTAGATGVSTVNLLSSVVANNATGEGGGSPDIAGVITSLGYNLVEDTSGGTFAATTGDTTGVDPALGPLALNGGTTLNYQPLPGSVLIDSIPTGTSQCGVAPFNVDQKNFTRPTDSNGDGAAACEKGSSESIAAPTAASVTISGRAITANGRGIRNVRVILTDGNGGVRMAVTSTFGYYRFTDVAAGETYVVSAKGKRFTFSQPSQVLNVDDDAANVNFIANP